MCRFDRTIRPAVVLLILLFLPLQSQAEGLFKHAVQGEFEQVYQQVRERLEASRFFVVQELNIGASLSGFSSRWGENYNRNKLENIRSLLVCNAWYANEVSNLDADMVGLCPLRINLTSRGNTTTILFARPSTFADNSPAKPLLLEVETEVINALKGTQ